MVNIQKILVKFDIIAKNISLYRIAFTHPSVNDYNNYQKLEFLGDSILGFFISVLAYKLKPDFDEGKLTHLKIYLVNTKFLSDLSKKFGFAECLITKNLDAKKSSRVLADIFESFIAAVFLDQKYEKVEKLIEKIFTPFIINFDYEKSIDFKTRIQELLQNKDTHISYSLIKRENNNGKIFFKVGLYCNNTLLSYGIAESKKTAEQKAAKKAYFSIIEKY